jgi:hypothetical protein
MSIKYHTRKAYGGFEAYFQTFLASALNGAKQLVPLADLVASGEIGLPVSIE